MSRSVSQSGSLAKAAGGPSFAPVGRSVYGNRWVALGDSITQAASTSSSFGDGWPTYAGLLSAQRINLVYNAGIAGNTSADILSRVQADVISKSPTFCTIKAGTNDVNQGIAFTTYVANMVAIVRKLREAGIAPVLCTIAPRASKRAGTSQTNAWIRRYAAQEGIPLIDFNTLLTEPSTGGYISAYDSGDGTHPNAAGYLAMGNLVNTVLAPFLPPWSPPLPTENADGTNLLPNGLFLTDANADGVPDSWTASGGSSGFTHTIITGDTAIKGNWAQIAMSAAASARTIEYDVNGAGGGFAAGDVLQLSGRIDVSGLSGGSTPIVYFRFYNGSVNTDYKPVSSLTQTITNGVFSMTKTVPAGTTFVKILLSAGAGTGTYKFAQLGLYNLTRLGLG